MTDTEAHGPIDKAAILAKPIDSLLDSGAEQPTRRFFTFVPGVGRYLVPAAHAATVSTALAYAKQIGSVNLIEQLGPASKPGEVKLLWRRADS